MGILGSIYLLLLFIVLVIRSQMDMDKFKFNVTTAFSIPSLNQLAFSSQPLPPEDTVMAAAEKCLNDSTEN